jgi:GTP-binding protein YchF
MEIGIIGLSQSGKTTVFNALTRGRARVAMSTAGAKPNVGVAKVPDARLDRLTEMYRPQKTTPAEVVYVDIPGAPEGLGKQAGIGGQFLNTLQKSDALLHVVRAFPDPSVPHIAGSVDPWRDIGTLDMELLFSDLGILERRIGRIETGLKGAKPAQREAAEQERAVLERIKARLEQNVPVRAQGISETERFLGANYQFLTAKPLLVVLNIDEAQLSEAEALDRELAQRAQGPGVRGAVLAGKLEQDLGQMDEAEEREFRASLEAGESGLSRMVRYSYDLLGLVSFFTVGPDECKAWTISAGTPAVKAAGKVHSDIERGFIRAEVVRYDDLAACGGLPEARKRGLLRLEGKTYEVSDGDVINFLFSV